MARYIVLRVESDDTADKLLERFTPVEAINVVGLFASPTTFCEGKCNRAKNRHGVPALIRSKKWGISFCSECKKPLSGFCHQPRNLLEHQDLHPRFRDFNISVWEPYSGDPYKKYGDNILEISQKKLAEGRAIMRRYRMRERRKGRE